MMRSLTTGLGILTILAVTGAITSMGQTMLGFKPASQANPSETVIADTAPSAPKVAAVPRVATPAPVAPAAVQSPAKPAPAAQQAPAAHSSPARPAPAASAPSPQPAQGGLGQVANVANILLNLPQVLSQTQVRPAPDNNEEHESSHETHWVPNHVPKEKGRSHRKVEDGDDH